MYFISEGKVYVKDGEAYRNVGFTAKNKVITTSELESITMVKGTVVKDNLDNYTPLTQNEVFARFGLSEDNPIEVIAEAPKKTTKKK